MPNLKQTQEHDGDNTQALTEASYYTTRELSAFLNIPISTLTRYRREGLGPRCSRTSQRNYRYAKADVLRYIDEIRIRTTAPTSIEEGE